MHNSFLLVQAVQTGNPLHWLDDEEDCCSRRTVRCQEDNGDYPVSEQHSWLSGEAGHKSVQSLNHYKVPSLCQQETLSHILSNYSPPSFSVPHVRSAQTTPQAPLVPVQQQANTLHLTRNASTWSTSSANQGLLKEATFNTCTVYFNFGQRSSEEPRRIKRPRVLYSDSDSD